MSIFSSFTNLLTPITARAEKVSNDKLKNEIDKLQNEVTNSILELSEKSKKIKELQEKLE